MASKRRGLKAGGKVNKEAQIHIRVTADQKRELEAAATYAGMGLSTWMLAASLEKARADRGG